MLTDRRFEFIAIVRYLFKWTLYVLPVALVTGSLVAFFLWSLDAVTTIRWQHPWLLWLLPIAGILIYFGYRSAGKNAEAGNNLIINEIHEPGGGVPARMTPLVLAGTLITHLFGGSAGREGTAVQMGGSIAGFMARTFKLAAADIPVLLMTGIAAGFGAVFGTPVAGAIFALEVLAIGRMQYKALMPCFMAAILAHFTCVAWGIHHTLYHISNNSATSWRTDSAHFRLLVTVIIAGALFGFAAKLFSWLVTAIKNLQRFFGKQQWLFPFIGGCIVITLTYLLGTRDYLGIGVISPNEGGVSIVSSFFAGGAHPLSWLWKLIFTAVTLGTGFKGGEVTPLFFIGATLGNVIASQSGSPIDLMAGLGFIAVFAGATNTPIACTLMGVELFGGDHVLYYAVACFTAYYCSGRSGIYHAQRAAVPKVLS